MNSPFVIYNWDWSLSCHNKRDSKKKNAVTCNKRI